MNAPYEGDRGQGTGGPSAGDPYAGPPEPGHSGAPDPHLMPPQQAAEMYPPDGYGQDPYPGQDAYGQHPTVQEPVAGALHDHHTRPVPPPYQGPPPSYRGDEGQAPYRGQGPQSAYPGYSGQEPRPPYPGPPPSGQIADPRQWAEARPPAPQAPQAPQGPGRPSVPSAEPVQAPYGAVDDPFGPTDQAGQAGDESHHQDAFAYLFRDQQHDSGRPVEPFAVPTPATEAAGQGEAPGPAAAAAPAPVSPPKPRGKASSLLKSSAVMAAGTLVSRITGFVRTIVITAALGPGMLGDSFTVAYTLPTMVYILTVGGGLNSVFVPQLVRSMKEDEDGGEAYANRLLTLVMVALGLITVVVVVAAPWLIRLQSPTIADDAVANSVTVTFARYCLPTIFFMGIHVVMGQILNARGKFGAMMWTPVLNNIVMIFAFGSFLWVYGTSAHTNMDVQTIPPEGVRLLGIGTLLGLVVQALAMIPYLREAGFRFRPRFDWRGHGLGKTMALAKWTMLFVLANQAGLIVVTELSTAAGHASGAKGAGFLAYTNAQLIWAMPQAIITVSVMAALLPRLSRAAADGDPGAVRDDISQGLRNSAVVIVPLAFAFVALGVPMCTLLYGSSQTEAAKSIGYILMAFGVGLIPYSVQYVVLRGFYAYEDTRTPFYNTVIVAVCNAAGSWICYMVLPARWAVTGMAGVYGLAYAVGVGVAWRRLSRRLGGDLDGTHVLRSYARLSLASVPAALIGGVLSYLTTRTLGYGVLGSIAALIVGGIALLAIFVLVARRLRIQELNSVLGMVRGRLGR
ncbi:murein biosynthesis integral membrane protein MurJ [Streptomyces odontomachi]|uniref:murein biosynthesis integral membrane protein MurJ n=1 Tax=Streptomyces odontomachi TaxID=2944940 RepID=UPI00210C7FED|nr:murein biosynthesis integral membrane protein MurJ [Streptomyces sp. ODS25]